MGGELKTSTPSFWPTFSLLSPTFYHHFQRPFTSRRKQNQNTQILSAPLRTGKPKPPQPPRLADDPDFLWPPLGPHA